MKFRVPQSVGNSGIAEQLVASQEGFTSMELEIDHFHGAESLFFNSVDAQLFKIFSTFYGNQMFITAHNKKIDHSDRAVKSMECLRPLEHWDRGFESHSGYGCMPEYFLCSCSPV
jgi:hypothetical protein